MTDLADVRERLATLEAGQKYANKMLADVIQEFRDDLRPRVRSLETTKHRGSGFIAGISVVGSAITTALIGIVVKTYQ